MLRAAPASSNRANDRRMRGQEDLTVKVLAHTGSCTHLCQAGRTYGNGLGAVTPATPPRPVYASVFWKNIAHPPKRIFMRMRNM